MSGHKVGDRVKVTFEANVVVPSSYLDGKVVVIEDNKVRHWVEPQSVEKVEPPVETFKAGDIVRSKAHGYTYLVTDAGYVELSPHVRGTYWDGPSHFTSENYERVNLVEAPF